MLHVCHDEYELYFNFFGMGGDELRLASISNHLVVIHIVQSIYLNTSIYILLFFHCILYSQLLEYFSNCLYTSLRPVVIKINHLETLAELCSILKVGFIDMMCL